MVAVGLVAVAVAVERFLFRTAVELVKSDDGYFVGEAITVCPCPQHLLYRDSSRRDLGYGKASRLMLEVSLCGRPATCRLATHRASCGFVHS